MPLSVSISATIDPDWGTHTAPLLECVTIIVIVVVLAQYLIVMHMPAIPGAGDDRYLDEWDVHDMRHSAVAPTTQPNWLTMSGTDFTSHLSSTTMLDLHGHYCYKPGRLVTCRPVLSII